MRQFHSSHFQLYANNKIRLFSVKLGTKTITRFFFEIKLTTSKINRNKPSFLNLNQHNIVDQNTSLFLNLNKHNIIGSN
jgi:RNA binding exosome subunit